MGMDNIIEGKLTIEKSKEIINYYRVTVGPSPKNRKILKDKDFIEISATKGKLYYQVQMGFQIQTTHHSKYKFILSIYIQISENIQTNSVTIEKPFYPTVETDFSLFKSIIYYKRIPSYKIKPIISLLLIEVDYNINSNINP